MLVPSSYVPSACRAVAPDRIILSRESTCCSPLAPASASQRLHHDYDLVSRLCCLAARCLPGCQHLPHLYTSLQPHAVRWVSQTPEACLDISRKLHMQRCRVCRVCRVHSRQKKTGNTSCLLPVPLLACAPFDHLRCLVPAPLLETLKSPGGHIVRLDLFEQNLLEYND